MTGLLADVVALRDAVGSTLDNDAPIDELSKIVAQNAGKIHSVTTDAELLPLIASHYRSKHNCDAFFSPMEGSPPQSMGSEIFVPRKIF